MLSVVGFALVLLGVLLALGRRAVIRRVTSRSLGSLAPGFAATDCGYLVYTFLVADLGFVVLSIGAGSVPLIIGAVLAFLVASVVVLGGEVAVYRRLKR